MTAIRILAAAACCLVTTTAGMAGKPATTVAPVPLSVEFDDADPNRITSDGGTYVDGQNGVSANFDKYGNLIIDFQTTRDPRRWVQYQYDSGERFTAADNYLSTIPTRLDPDTDACGESSGCTPGPLQNLGFDTDGQGQWQCVRGYITYTLDDSDRTQFWHGFQRAPGNISTADTAYMVVRRVQCEDCPPTWEVEPTAECSGNNGWAKLISTPSRKFNFTDHGTKYLPFKLTLRAR